jgi:hypothetical protein
MVNVQKVCHFSNTPSSQTFRIYLRILLFNAVFLCDTECHLHLLLEDTYVRVRVLNKMKHETFASFAVVCENIFRLCRKSCCEEMFMYVA